MPDCLIVFGESDGKSVLGVIVVLCGLELLTNSSVPLTNYLKVSLHLDWWIVKALTRCSYGTLIPSDDF